MKRKRVLTLPERDPFHINHLRNKWKFCGIARGIFLELPNSRCNNVCGSAVLLSWLALQYNTHYTSLYPAAGIHEDLYSPSPVHVVLCIKNYTRIAPSFAIDELQDLWYAHHKKSQNETKTSFTWIIYRWFCSWKSLTTTCPLMSVNITRTEFVALLRFHLKLYKTILKSFSPIKSCVFPKVAHSKPWRKVVILIP